MVQPVALVRYGRLRHIGEFVPKGDVSPGPQAQCVVQTPRGVELGTVLGVLPRQDGTAVAPLVRLATGEDIRRADELGARAEDDLLEARVATKDRAELRIVAVERLLDGERALVYYTATGRVDVPTVMSQLGELLGVETHLEQVGARGRARLCGGSGVCGRELCCSSFLRKLTPVTMRMAKVQGLDLDPRTTAGACGRLKCCLRYENDLYEERGRGLPGVGWEVRAARGAGKVLAVDVLRRRLLVHTEEGKVRTLFGDEVEEMTPPQRVLLPLAGEPEPAVEHEEEEDEGSQEEAAPPPEEGVEPGWSQLAKRLWRRVNPRARKKDEPSDEEE